MIIKPRTLYQMLRDEAGFTLGGGSNNSILVNSPNLSQRAIETIENLQIGSGIILYYQAPSSKEQYPILGTFLGEFLEPNQIILEHPKKVTYTTTVLGNVKIPIPKITSMKLEDIRFQGENVAATESEIRKVIQEQARYFSKT